MQRAEPSIDQGSGLPAEQWLALQVKELEDRSLSDRTPIAVLRLRVDDHGLATEEELVDVADRMQARLRAYDRLFRVGGHNFILLAPGADARRARRVALKVREAVGSVEMWRGGSMRVICGVSASLEGEPFVYEWVSAKADQALEEADLNGGIAVVASVRHERLHVVGGRGSERSPGSVAYQGGGDDSSPRRSDR